MAESPHIPESVRSAALTRLEDYGVTSVLLGEEFLKREGYGSFADYIERIGELYGGAEAERVRERMTELAAPRTLIRTTCRRSKPAGTQ